MELRQAKTWRITRTASWIKLLIFSLVSLLAVHAHIMNVADYSWPAYNRILIPMLLSYSGVLIAWLTVVPWAILKKRTPLLIALAADLTLTVLLPKGKIKELPLERFAYTYHRYSNYSILVFHQNDVATRGHALQRPFLVIMGLRWGRGWNLKKLDEIAEHLAQNEVPFVVADDKLFLTRLLE